MIQFAIVGCGRIALRHAENIHRVGKLAAVCDTVPERARQLADGYGARVYTSLDELLQKEPAVNIVSVCTPNGFHAEHSIKSLQAGKHVLCEKPLCLTSAAAWQLIETEKFTRQKLFVVKSARFNPLLIELKKRIDENALGKIYSFQLSCFWNRPREYYTDWHGKAFPDGGTLYTQFSHYIDAMIWLLGELESVTGYRSNAAHQDILEFEDNGVAALQMKSGVLGGVNWSVNSYAKNCEIALTLLAEKGTIGLGGEYMNEVKYQQLDVPFPVLQNLPDSNEYVTYKGSMSHHRQVYENLVAELNNPSPLSNSFDGLKTVEAIEKIYKGVSSPVFLSS